MTDKFQLSDEERLALWYLPAAPGGKVIPEEMQRRLQDLGVLSPPDADGRRGVTVFGDLVKRGQA